MTKTFFSMIALLFAMTICAQNKADTLRDKNDTILGIEEGLAGLICYFPQVEYNASLNIGVASEGTLPFWMQANQYGLVPQENYRLLNVEVKRALPFTYKRFDWGFGVNTVASVANKANVRFRDYYIGGRYKMFRLFVGAKADDIIYDGLSSTNGNFIQSANARPYPEIALDIPYLNVPFTKGVLQFRGAISEGIMFDDRYVDKPRVHHKNFYLKAEKGRFALEFGLNHYAQWGGKSLVLGQLPKSFDAYADMFFAKNNSEYDQLGGEIDHNRVGNHLGMLDGRFHYRANSFNLTAYRQVIFEDSSGQNFFNRDALHGIYVKRATEKAWLQSFLIEYYYTNKQSGDKTGKKEGLDELWTGKDNYFNQSVYRSGWTSYGYTIGTPFFTALQGDDYALGISNNRIEAWHGGVSGFLAHKFPYKAMLSYTDNIGTYYKPIDKQQVTAYFEMTIPLAVQNYPVNITLGTAIDEGQYLKDNFGAFIKISTNGCF